MPVVSTATELFFHPRGKRIRRIEARGTGRRMGRVEGRRPGRRRPYSKDDFAEFRLFLSLGRERRIPRVSRRSFPWKWSWGVGRRAIRARRTKTASARKGEEEDSAIRKGPAVRRLGSTKMYLRRPLFLGREQGCSPRRPRWNIMRYKSSSSMAGNIAKLNAECGGS